MNLPENQSNVGPGEHRQALDPAIGTGTPETAPYESVEIPWLRREPVVALALSIVLANVAALVTELASSATSPALVALLGTIATLATVGAIIARRHVTPVQRPMLDGELPASAGREAG